MSRRPLLGLLVAAIMGVGSLAAAPAAVAADRDCGDFSSQRDAQIFFLNEGGPHSDPHRLDSDGDGIACETNPAPYYYGTTPPGGGPASQPQITAVRSTVLLALNPNRRIAGESFRITVSVRPAISRKVMVQRRVDGRWKVFGTGVTGRNGKTSGVFKAPKATATYRAVVQAVSKGNKKYSAAESRTRSIAVQRQRVVLDFDDRTVALGEQVRALVQATPIRAGRSVILQMRTAGTWRTVRTSRFDRRGRASFTITPELGRASFRALAVRHQGAASAHSAVKTVTATDVRPPSAPFDLVAIPGDGLVQLSWSRIVSADFDHHEVWMRTAGTDWMLVTVTETTDLEVTLLENGVTHWFTVTSVDNSGNVSDMATEVAATPTATRPANRIHGR